MALKHRNSLIWKLVLPAPILLILSVTLAWFLIPNLAIENSKQDAKNSAVQTANQFKTIRGYYTKNVISEVKKSARHQTPL